MGDVGTFENMSIRFPIEEIRLQYTYDVFLYKLVFLREG